MPVRVSAEARRKNRLIATRLALLTLRYMENWSRVAEDYDEAMIAVAVAAITTERLTRIKLSDEQMDLDYPLPRELYGRCSVQAVAQATGLNRETARRKINNLVERGLLEKSGPRSIMFREGFPQEQIVAELIDDQLEAFRRTAEALVRDGVLDGPARGN
jgi:hypothetical protein